MEKEFWGEQGWTTKEGAEGGSFEADLLKSNLSRWLSGLSITTDDEGPL